MSSQVRCGNSAHWDDVTDIMPSDTSTIANVLLRPPIPTTGRMPQGFRREDHGEMRARDVRIRSRAPGDIATVGVFSFSFIALSRRGARFGLVGGNLRACAMEAASSSHEEDHRWGTRGTKATGCIARRGSQRAKGCLMFPDHSSCGPTCLMMNKQRQAAKQVRRKLPLLEANCGSAVIFFFFHRSRLFVGLCVPHQS